MPHCGMCKSLSEGLLKSVAETSVRQEVTDNTAARSVAETSVRQEVTDNTVARSVAETSVRQEVTDNTAARSAAETSVRQEVYSQVPGHHLVAVRVGVLRTNSCEVGS